MAFFMLQVLSSRYAGINIVGIASFLPISNEFSEIDLIDVSLNRSRFSSFFSEPAHFVQYLLPFIAIELFDDEKKRKYLSLLFAIICLLLSQSGNAIIGLLCIGLGYTLYVLTQSTGTRKIIFFVIISVIGLFLASSYINTNVGQELLSRQSEISGAIDQTSGFTRVYRGYYVLKNYNLLELLLGVNDTNVLSDIIRSSEVAWTFGVNDYYFNGFQNLIVKTGLIGLFIFYSFVLCLWKRKEWISRIIIMTYIFLSLQASLFFSFTMILYLLLSDYLSEKVETI